MRTVKKQKTRHSANGSASVKVSEALAISFNYLHKFIKEINAPIGALGALRLSS